MKRSWHNFNVLCRHLSGGTEEMYERPLLGETIFGPTFESRLCEIRSRITNPCSATFDQWPSCKEL